MTARASLLVLLTALAACGEKKPVRPAVPGPAAPAAPVAGAAAARPADAQKPEQPEWSYTSVGKRDPFRSFLSEVERGQPFGGGKCGTALGRFELEQLRLVAVVTGLEDPVAMVEAPTGVGYSVRRGACIGKNGGVVAAVRSGEVVVSEWSMRADGTRDRTQTVLRLPKEAALNLEE